MSETIEPGSLLPRYMAGEHEAVWRDMARLGGDVRSSPYFDDAWAVARETMRRARHNVELIVRRLDAMGYQFWNGERTAEGAQPFLMSVGGRVVARGSPLEQARSALAMDVSHVPGGDALKQLLAGLVGPYQAMSERADRQRDARIAEKAQITDHLEDPAVFSPPDEKELTWIRGLEAKGLLLPLSWRAWIEEVGDVNLAGAHPALSFWETPGFPGVYADPLMVTSDHLEFLSEAWEEEHDAGQDAGELDVQIGYDPQLKARLAIHQELLDEGYELTLPNAGADAELRLGGKQQSFVDYLRTAFRWGGFPGWEGQAAPPHRELAQLTEGLLAL